MKKLFSKINGLFCSDKIKCLFKGLPQHERLKSVLEVVNKDYFVSEVKLTKKEVNLKMVPKSKPQEVRTIPIGNEKDDKMKKFINPAAEGNWE